LSWTKEDILLLCFCRTDIDTRIKEKINRLVEAEGNRVNWENFLYKARENSISGLIYYKIKDIKHEIKSLPSKVFEELKKDYYGNAVQNTMNFKKIREFLDSLDKVGVPVIVLKGGALAESDTRI